jgi:hypothetical protein
VDVIIEVASYAEYARLSKRLRGYGFSEDASEGAPLCRWVCEGMMLDVIPTDERILGFSNRWYSAALRHAHEIEVGDLHLRVVTAPYFIGTKLEALHGRGRGDFYASRDLEDIVAVVDGRGPLLDEIKSAPSALRTYIAREFRKLLSTPQFVEALPGHLPGDQASQARIASVLSKLEALSATRSKSQKISTRKSRRG